MIDDIELTMIAEHWLIDVKKIPPALATELVMDGKSEVAREELRTARFVMMELKAAAALTEDG